MGFIVLAKNVPTDIDVMTVGLKLQQFGDILGILSDERARLRRPQSDIKVIFATLSSAMRAVRHSPLLIDGLGIRVVMNCRRRDQHPYHHQATRRQDGEQSNNETYEDRVERLNRELDDIRARRH